MGYGEKVKKWFFEEDDDDVYENEEIDHGRRQVENQQVCLKKQNLQKQLML